MNQPAEWTDKHLLEALCGSHSQREEAFAYLYQASGWRGWVVQHVSSEGGDGMQGEDVFQEAVLLFDRNVREGRFKAESSLKTYFFGIAKQHWFNKKRSLHPSQELNPERHGGATDSPETQVIDEERRRLINLVIENLGEICKKVLPMYKLSLSNEEIAKELGLSSPEMAKKYAYRCREKFKEFVMKREHLRKWLNIRPDDDEE